MSAAILEQVGFRYAGAPHDALDDVSLVLEPGELVLLEGPSGGGKSTLLRTLTGAIPHLHGGVFRGRCAVGGQDTRDARPGSIARRAAIVFQDPESQGVMRTVGRDVAFGPECLGRPPATVREDTAWALRAAGAEHLADRALAELSSGERQRAALAAALAMRTPLLLLDEPTSQLDPASARAAVAALARLTAEGTCVVVAEHRADRVAAVAARRLDVAAGRLSEGADGPGETAVPPRPAAGGREALVADGLRLVRGGRVVLDAVGLVLRHGTVTALTGENGSGKTTLLRALAGLDHPAAGRIVLGGEDVTATPAELRFPRIGLVPQDPGRHLLCETVHDEVAFALVQIGARRRERATRVAHTLGELEIAPHAARHPLDLSVGERERVALAAALVARPDVILLDEPTRGMDPRRMRALAGLLRARAAEGAAVLVATHDEGFAARVADRRLHAAGGRVDEAETPLPVAGVAG